MKELFARYLLGGENLNNSSKCNFFMAKYNLFCCDSWKKLISENLKSFFLQLQSSTNFFWKLQIRFFCSHVTCHVQEIIWGGRRHTSLHDINSWSKTKNKNIWSLHPAFLHSIQDKRFSFKCQPSNRRISNLANVFIAAAAADGTQHFVCN